MGKKELHKKLLNLIKEESPFNIGDEVWCIMVKKDWLSPCKYYIQKGKIKDLNVFLAINEREIEDLSISLYVGTKTGNFSIEQGGNVFKSKEEAKKALRKSEGVWHDYR